MFRTRERDEPVRCSRAQCKVTNESQVLIHRSAHQDLSDQRWLRDQHISHAPVGSLGLCNATKRTDHAQDGRWLVFATDRLKIGGRGSGDLAGNLHTGVYPANV